MKYAAEKVCAQGNVPVLLAERVTCFGYRDLVVDFRNFKIMQDLGYPVIFDATHSVQQMGGAEGKSSGAREYIGLLSKAAVAAGVDGLFLECHNNPDQAPSDGPNMITPKMLEEILSNTIRIRSA
jgi:2-dehydro-3-deoxyphosphooctonate aldolase (KDO 8-P synthase)